MPGELRTDHDVMPSRFRPEAGPIKHRISE
jgi:hypothetical protein